VKNLRTLTVSQVMERTGWPRSTVYSLMDRGDLATVRLGARGRYHVLESSLEEFFEKHTRGGSKPLPRANRAAERQAADDAVLPADGDRAFA